MSAATKARLVGALLVAVALWPLVQRQLVVRYDVNPWKLYGFAMYCTPHSMVVDLIDRSGERAREIHPQELPPPVRQAYERFVERRHTLGRLVPPEPIARQVLAALPEVADLTVAITVTQLPFASTELAPRTLFYRFRRP